MHLDAFDFGAHADAATGDACAIQSAIDTAFTVAPGRTQNAVVVSSPPAAYFYSPREPGPWQHRWTDREYPNPDPIRPYVRPRQLCATTSTVARMF